MDDIPMIADDGRPYVPIKPGDCLRFMTDDGEMIGCQIITQVTHTVNGWTRTEGIIDPFLNDEEMRGDGQ